MKRRYDIKFGVKKHKQNPSNVDYANNLVKGKYDSAYLLSYKVVREASINIGPSYKTNKEKIEQSINVDQSQNAGLSHTIYVSKFNEYEDNLGASNTLYAKNFDQYVENDALMRFIGIEKLDKFYEINNSINNRLDEPALNKLSARKLTDDNWYGAMNIAMEWSDIDITKQEVKEHKSNINKDNNLKELDRDECSTIYRFSGISDFSSESPLMLTSALNENTIFADQTIESIYLVEASGDCLGNE